MKPGFLTQIMVVPVTGISLQGAFIYALKMEFKMFSFNGAVYSTYLIDKNVKFNNLGKDNDFFDNAILFMLSDLVDYNYNASSI